MTMDIFKIYDSLAQAYAKDIDGYKEIIKAVEAMMVQKEIALQDIKDKIISLMKQSIAFPDTGAVEDVKYLELDVEAVPSVIERKTRPRKQQEETVTKKGKIHKTDISILESHGADETSNQRRKTGVIIETGTKIMCQYHPQAPAVDKKRQICSSCRWKLQTYGLMEYYEDPAVVSYLKGENTSVPNVGQPMCPVHPAKPSYNKKTGLCQRCQSRARVIGVTGRKLTDEELEIVSGPVAW